MLRFAKFIGEWNDYRDGWRWHKLRAAAELVAHQWIGQAHRAHADVLAARSVWLWMQSGAPLPPPTDDDPDDVPFRGLAGILEIFAKK